MTAKHRVIEIATIIAVTAFIVFMARSCGETIPDVSASIEDPNATTPLITAATMAQAAFDRG